MDIVVALTRLWRHKLWLVPVTLFAAFVAVSVAFHVTLLPPKLESKEFSFGAASKDLLVDSGDSMLTDLDAPLGALTDRTAIYAQLLESRAVLQGTAERAGTDLTGLSVSGTVGDEASQEPTATERASELAEDPLAGQLFYRVDAENPVISLTTQASDAASATRLAEAAGSSLAAYLGSIQAEQGIPRKARIRIDPLGPATGGPVAQRTDLMLAAMAGMGVLVLGIVLILAIPSLLNYLRLARAVDAGFEPAPSSGGQQNGHPSERPVLSVTGDRS